MMPIVTVVQNCTNYAFHNNCIKLKMETYPMKIFLSLLLAIIVFPLVTACVTPQKNLVDAKVRELCEKDGGIKVYERVKLPAERFTKRGSIRIPAKSLANPDDEYYYESSMHYLQKGNPELIQLRNWVYRKSDSKLLGENTTYIRRGGDLPGPWHPSSFVCPKDADIVDLNKRIFIKN